MQDLSKIAAKIAALQSKADSTNFPEEAATFAAKAQELMLQYNLTRADLVRSGEIASAAYDHQTFDAVYDKWRYDLARCIARTNFCETCLMYGHDKDRLDIVGQKHNIEMVLYLLAYLPREIRRLARAEWNSTAQYEKREHGLGRGAWMNSFCVGAGETVRARLWTQYNAQQAAQSATGDASRALVVVNDAELKEALDKFHPGSSTIKHRAQLVHDSARYAGQEAGETISLARPIGDGTVRGKRPLKGK